MPERDLIGIQILRKRLEDERRQPEFATDLLLCEKTVRNLEKSKRLLSFCNVPQSIENTMFLTSVRLVSSSKIVELFVMELNFC